MSEFTGCRRPVPARRHMACADPSGAVQVQVNGAANGTLATATEHLATVHYYGGYGYRSYGYSRYGYGYRGYGSGAAPHQQLEAQCPPSSPRSRVPEKGAFCVFRAMLPA